MNKLQVRVLSHNGLFYPQYEEEYKRIFFKKKNRWVNFKQWSEGSFDLIGIPDNSGYFDHQGFFTEEACISFIQKELHKQEV